VRSGRLSRETRKPYSWEPFGVWILFAEIALFGFLPALWLLRAGKVNTTFWSCPRCGLDRQRSDEL